jgi:hypothetical protein
VLTWRGRTQKMHHQVITEKGIEIANLGDCGRSNFFFRVCALLRSLFFHVRASSVNSLLVTQVVSVLRNPYLPPHRSSTSARCSPGWWSPRTTPRGRGWSVTRSFLLSPCCSRNSCPSPFVRYFYAHPHLFAIFLFVCLLFPPCPCRPNVCLFLCLQKTSR